MQPKRKLQDQSEIDPYAEVLEERFDVVVKQECLVKAMKINGFWSREGVIISIDSSILLSKPQAGEIHASAEDDLGVMLAWRF
jgi:hypothetical protein